MSCPVVSGEYGYNGLSVVTSDQPTPEQTGDVNEPETWESDSEGFGRRRHCIGADLRKILSGLVHFERRKRNGADGYGA